MNPPFTPQELAAAEEAFRRHREGKCQVDCGFCYDLELAGPQYLEELKRIQGLKTGRKAKTSPAPRQKSLIPPIEPPKRVGKGQKAPLAGRIRR